MSGPVRIDLTEDSDEERTPKARDFGKNPSLISVALSATPSKQFNIQRRHYIFNQELPTQNQQHHGPGSSHKPIELLDDTASKASSSYSRQPRKQKPFPSPSQALKESPGSLKTNLLQSIPIHKPRPPIWTPSEAPPTTSEKPSTTLRDTKHSTNPWPRCRTCAALDQACDGEQPCSSCAEPGYRCLYPDDVGHSSPQTANGSGSCLEIPALEKDPKDQVTAVPLIPLGDALNLSEYLSDENDQVSDVETESPGKSPELTVKAYIEKLDELEQEINAFQEDQTRRMLRQASLCSRDAAEPCLRQMQSPFHKMPAFSHAEKLSHPNLRLHIKDIDAKVLYKRNKVVPIAVPTMVSDSSVVSLPKYKSIGRLGSALLARNNTIAKYNPYSCEDEKLDKEAADKKYQEMQQRYKSFEKVSDSIQAQRKCAELTELWRPHLEDMLSQMHLRPGAIDRYFREKQSAFQRVLQSSGLVESTLTPWYREQSRVCISCQTSPDGRTTEALGDIDFAPHELFMVGLLACAYHDVAGLSLWHMVLTWSAKPRKSITSNSGTGPIGSMCLICCLHNCSIHGMYLDEDKQQYELNDVSQVHVDDPEPSQNTRYNVSLPYISSSSAEWSASNTKGALVGWAKGKIDTTNSGRMEERDIFIPCSHEGPCRDDNPQCSCAEGKIQCEYMCGCHEKCPRRFKGCACGTGPARVCFKDDRCACWRVSRECDPWLCKGCGVLEVLDQANKYNDEIRQGRCSNNRLQLGLPARTIKAPSEVQGYGLFAGENLRKGDFIAEYKGEILTRGESDRRGAMYSLSGTEYLFNLNTSQEIDATNFGNKTRFMNNSLLEDNINVLGLTMLCNGLQRVMLYAKQDIQAGDELLYNYDYPKEVSSKFWERGQKPAKDKAVVVPGATKAAAKKPAEKRTAKPSTAAADGKHWQRPREPNGLFKKRAGSPPAPDDGQYSSQSPVMSRRKRKRPDIDKAGAVPGQEELAIQPSDESDYYESGDVSTSDSVSEAPVESSDSDQADEGSTEVRLNRFKNKDGRFGGKSQAKAWETRKKSGGAM